MNSLNNPVTLEEQLYRYFGFSSFRGDQREVIESTLSGHSTLAVFPTGRGKSLCYQLPALLQEGLTLVISPLIALMKDQVDFLEKHSIPAARYDTSLSRKEWEQVNVRIKENRLKILFVSPERLGNERFTALLKETFIQTLVIDEIHSISEWGHNFRPDYLKLADYYKELGIPKMIGLTATADKKVVKDICRLFSIAPEHCIVSGFHRPNLFIRIHPVNGKTRDQQLLEVLKTREQGPTIVYVSLQKTTREVREFLHQKGFTTRTYHAGMSSDDRKEVQEWFMDCHEGIIVATIAFGMGIDKADVRQVIHYNLPKSLENYMQEIGRAGRDGNPSDCTLLYSTEDRIILENFIYGDTPARESIHRLLNALHRKGDDFSISRYEISQEFDIRDLVGRTIFTYLELEGYIKSIGAFANEYNLILLKPRETLAQVVGSQRYAFLEALFAAGKQGRKWLNIDLLKAAQQTGEDLRRIRKALAWLESEGWIECQIKNMRQNYRKTETLWHVEEMTESMMKRFSERESSDIHRIDLIEELSKVPQCRTTSLLRYFGDDLPGGQCGHCDVCEGSFTLPQTDTVKEDLSTEREKELDMILQILEEQNLTPRQKTLFLCGISSPALSKKRLTRDKGFGSFQDLRFDTVKKLVNSSVDSPRPIL